MTEIRMDVDPRSNGFYRVQVLAYRGVRIEVQHNAKPVEVERQEEGSVWPFFVQRANFTVLVNDRVAITCGSRLVIVRIEKPLPFIVEGGLKVKQYFNGMDYPGILKNDEELREIMFLKQRALIKK